MVLSQTRHQERRDEEVLSSFKKKLFRCFCHQYTFIANEVRTATYSYYFMQVLVEAKRIAELRMASKVIF